MNILLTNDDGVHAPGLAAIYQKLLSLGTVTVVAPWGAQSGTSHGITFTRPVVCRPVETPHLPNAYAVEGTPADCVKLACMQLQTKQIDLIVSGINSGANVGFNVRYSGTVAAAVEGTFMGIPSVAMSLALDTHMDFDTAAAYCFDVLQHCLPVSRKTVLNVNIPPLSSGVPKGIRAVPQSTMGFDEYYDPQKTGVNPSFQPEGGLPRTEETLTDTMALATGFITVTPLHADMTEYIHLRDLESHVSNINLNLPGAR